MFMLFLSGAGRDFPGRPLPLLQRDDHRCRGLRKVRPTAPALHDNQILLRRYRHAFAP